MTEEVDLDVLGPFWLSHSMYKLVGQCREQMLGTGLEVSDRGKPWATHHILKKEQLSQTVWMP